MHFINKEKPSPLPWRASILTKNFILKETPLQKIRVDVKIYERGDCLLFVKHCLDLSTIEKEIKKLFLELSLFQSYCDSILNTKVHHSFIFSIPDWVRYFAQ